MSPLITRQKSICLSTDITLSHFLFIVVIVAGIEWCVHLGWNEWVREGWKEAVTSGQEAKLLSEQQSIETEEDAFTSRRCHEISCNDDAPRDYREWTGIIAPSHSPQLTTVPCMALSHGAMDIYDRLLRGRQ